MKYVHGTAVARSEDGGAAERPRGGGEDGIGHGRPGHAHREAKGENCVADGNGYGKAGGNGPSSAAGWDAPTFLKNLRRAEEGLSPHLGRVGRHGHHGHDPLPNPDSDDQRDCAGRGGD